MARQSKPLIADRVEEIRSRLLLGTAESAVFEATSRLTDLKSSLEELRETANTELFRYFPVAAIATLEAHFRTVVAMIIDTGGQYTANGLALLGDRVKASEVILSIHKKTVSIGEVVAYSLPFSSLSHLEDVYDALLGQKFKQLSKTAEDPYFSRDNVPGRSPLVSDISSLWAELHQTFRDRHILAHESASQFTYDYSRAKVAVDSVSLIIETTDSVLWSTVLKDEPLTQSEINVAAWEKYRLTRNELAAAIRTKRQQRDAEEMPTFRKLHFNWKRWVGDWCHFSADRYAGGSIRRLIEASELSLCFKERIRQIESVTGR